MNKFKCKLKNIILMFVLLIFCISPVLTGCDFSVSSSKRLSTPQISLSSINKTISWDEIDNATDYQIYMNSQLIDTIETIDDDRIAYDFSGLLTNSGKYSFYVIATTDSLNRGSSYSSNVCEYEYTKQTILSANLNGESLESDDNITFTITGNNLSYMPLQRSDITYLLYAYSNTTGLNTFEITSNPVNLSASNIVTKNEVYAIRLAYSYVDGSEIKKVISSDIKYYNNIKDSFEGYTDKFYTFDGQINDYYIENQQELNNLVYFTFVNRLETFNIRISDNFKAGIAEIWQKSSTIDNVDYAIYSAYGQIYETMAYRSNNSGGRFASQNGDANTYTIKVDLNGIKECDTNILVTSVYKQSRSTGYYETNNYLSLKDKYGEAYDDFASDKQYLYTEVSTSEQLYWAVENKVTPKFANTTCRAYVIYQKAKSVLREIISDDMTDYEKALSIFDWIAINTNYDYTDYTKYTGDVSGWPMLIPAYYLEGVFMTGYSVCDGFSKAYSLMCNMLGIDCIRIVGDALSSSGASGGHAWNKVLFDIDTTDSVPAQYYLVDITWTEIMDEDKCEELSHTYFGLSDKDCEDTHFPYSGRKNKYIKYSASDNLYYYTYQTFEYEGVENDLVITSDQEMMDAFDYLLVSGRDTLEIIVDYDYMVASYNKYSTDGEYKSKTEIEKTYDESTGLLVTEYNPQTDTLVVYSYEYFGWQYTTSTTTYKYYKLRNSYVENVMKKVKFQEQYLFITEEHKLREYASGKVGMLFIFTQNLLIDSTEEYTLDNDTYTINPNGELSHIIKYFSTYNITGEYYVYVTESILRYAVQGMGDNGNITYNDVINYMVQSLNLTSNVNFSFKYVTKALSSDNMSIEVVYKMTVTAK